MSLSKHTDAQICRRRKYIKMFLVVVSGWGNCKVDMGLNATFQL